MDWNFGDEGPQPCDFKKFKKIGDYCDPCKHLKKVNLGIKNYVIPKSGGEIAQKKVKIEKCGLTGKYFHACPEQSFYIYGSEWPGQVTKDCPLLG